MQLETVTDEMEGLSDEAYAEAFGEWTSILTGMWDAIGKSMSDPANERRLKEYIRTFGSVPSEILQRAVDRAVRNNGTYQTVPTIGAIWDAVHKELGSPHDIDQALYEWNESKWNKIVVRFG